MAMVAAMVRFSRAVLLREDSRVQWGLFYAALWVLIIGTLLQFLGEADARRNMRVLVLIPGAFIVLHALLLWLGMAMRDASRPRPAARKVFDEEESEEEWDESPTMHPPPFAVRAFRVAESIAKWGVALFVALMVMIIGENIPLLRELDARLAPHRTTIGYVLGGIAAAGFAAFMIGAVTGRRFAVAGAVASMLGGAALAIVFAPPGVKLIVIVAVAYAIVRTIIGFIRRPAR